MAPISKEESPGTVALPYIRVVKDLLVPGVSFGPPLCGVSLKINVCSFLT